MSSIYLYIMFITFLLGLTEKSEYPEPIYDSKETDRPFTFGPGTHTDLTIYKNVSGWVGGREPDWMQCEDLRADYLDFIREHQTIRASGISIHLFSGEQWMTTLIKSEFETTTLFRIHEWDDDANYITEDIFGNLCKPKH
jgi:hypothetical protein